MSNEIDREELLIELNVAFGLVPYVKKARTGFDGKLWRRYQRNQQAYNQIVTLIGASKEVTDEWIEYKALEVMRLSSQYKSESYRREGVKNFIRKIVEEIRGK